MRHLAWLLGLLAAAPARALCLNEVLANPAGSEYEDEFIELWQDDSLAVDLTGWRVGDGTASDELRPWAGGSLLLAPGALALILDSGHQGAYLGELPPGTLLLGVPDGALGSGGLSNSSPEELQLLDAAGSLVDRVWTRPELPEGRSLERRESGRDCPDCWHESRMDGGTPGRPNSVRRRDDELQIRALDAAGLDLEASGRLGFHGRLDIRAGVAPCLDSLELPLELEAGAVRRIPWPNLPLPGQNPLRLEARPGTDEVQLLLDTLGWRTPAPGELFIEALQPGGTDWLQLRSGGCPCRLDGLRLTGRSFALTLSGELPAGGRLLLGAQPPVCPDPPVDGRSLSLGLAAGVELTGPAGQPLDGAAWPPPGAEAWPWRRLDPARAGDDPGNWRAAPGLQPGCTPADWPAPPQAPADWWVSSARLCPGDGPEGCWVVEAGPRIPAAWTCEIWTLEGRLRARFPVRATRLVWDGRDEAGRVLETGLYLVRLSGGGREQLHALALHRP
ncbi:MAG: lamin tail domain-containing protein [Candidatus Delongbacteria bacterium]